MSVRAIPLRGDTLIQAGDQLTESCATLVEATERRDHLVERLKRIVVERGDSVSSVDSTLEV